MADFGQFRGFGDKLFQGQLPTNLGTIADDFDDTDFTAFYNRVIAAGGTLSDDEITATNTLVIDLKSYSIWEKMKLLYPMVGASAAACAQNLKSASFTASFNGGFTYTTDGAKGNGTTGYINTNFNAFLQLLTPADCHMSIYQRDATQNNVNGIYYGPNFFIYFQSDTQIWSAIGNGSSTITNALGKNSMHTLTAIDSSAKLFKDTSELTTFTSSGTFPNFEVYMNSGNTNNNPNTYGNGVISYISLGVGLTDTDVTNLYTAVQKFNTTLSREV